MKPKIKNSTGNVFADLKIQNPKEALAKAHVVCKIHKIIKKKKLSQAKVSKILQMSQSEVSSLLRGYFMDFSLEKLLQFLNVLEQDVHN